MGYSKSRRSKGAPMQRNFGIGKPGVPNNEEFQSPYTNENTTPPTNSNETNRDIKETNEDNNINNNVESNKYGEFGNKTKTDSGIDRWINKPILEVLGLTKKQIAERKAKKAVKVDAAKKAVGEGTENLKQAKLVERNRKKADRQAKRDAKKAKRNEEKLAKYRKKNPVRGKEAINLFTDGGNKDLV